MMAKAETLTFVIILSLTALLSAQTTELVDVHGAIVAVNERNGWY